MPSQRLSADLAEALFSGSCNVGDPGASGTFSFNLKGLAQCNLVAGASGETRVLETLTANNYPVGQRFTVHLMTTGGGAVTISGAATADGVQVLTGAGAFVVYQVTQTSTSAKAWRVLYNSAVSAPALRGVQGGGVVSAPTISANAITLTAAQVLGGTIVLSNGAAAAVTWPDATLLAAALPTGAAVAGDIVDVAITAISAQTFTFSAGSGVTLTGTAPTMVGTTTGFSRLWRLTFTTASAYTVS